MIYLQLFYNFFITGLFSIGGGLATLPFLYDLSDKTGWFTHAELANMLAVSESTPGAIGINMATYVGFETASLPGAVIATLGLIAPGIIIILIIAKILEKFRESRYVQWGLYGLRAASIALIAAAGLSVVQISLIHYKSLGQSGVSALDIFDIKGLLLAVAILIGTLIWKKLHPVIWILIAAAVEFSFISPASDPYETVRLSAAPRMSERFRCVFHKTRQ